MQFQIGEINPGTPHLFADVAELLLLVDYQGTDRLHKNHLMELRNQGAISLEEVDDEVAKASALPADALRNDRIEAQLEGVWTQLEYRARTLRECYPFEVDGDFLVRRPHFSIEQRGYRLLLACSRLRSFGGGGIPQRWAQAFTFTCKHALRGLVPAHASVRIFDANSPDRRDHYGTDLRKALRVLGTDLRVLSINEAECDKQSTSGDAGLDLVAAIDFDDGAASAYAVMGQCGAQEKNWPSKTLEAHVDRYSPFFNLLFRWPAVMFTPVFYRTPTGEWVSNQDASGILLADRFRIMKLLGLAGAWPVLDTAEWFLNFEEEFSNVTAD